MGGHIHRRQKTRDKVHPCNGVHVHVHTLPLHGIGRCVPKAVCQTHIGLSVADMSETQPVWLIVYLHKDKGALTDIGDKSLGIYGQGCNTAQETQGNNFYACFPDSYIQSQRD